MKVVIISIDDYDCHLGRQWLRPVNGLGSDPSHLIPLVPQSASGSFDGVFRTKLRGWSYGELVIEWVAGVSIRLASSLLGPGHAHDCAHLDLADRYS